MTGTFISGILWDIIGNTNRKYFLTGGLNIDNVAQALSITPQPYAVREIRKKNVV